MGDQKNWKDFNASQPIETKEDLQQPLLFRVHQRFHDKIVSSFQECVLISTICAIVSFTQVA